MKINNVWKVESDERNVKLIKMGVVQKGENEGKETETVVGYYSNTSECLKAMIKKEIQGDGLRDLESVNAKIELLYKHIDEALANA